MLKIFRKNVFGMIFVGLLQLVLTSAVCVAILKLFGLM